MPPWTPHQRGREHHERGAQSLGEDPSQQSGAGRVAHQGSVRWVIWACPVSVDSFSFEFFNS